MGLKQLICLALIVHVTISKAAVTRKPSQSHLTKTTTLSPESVSNEYYYDDGAIEAIDHSSSDLTLNNGNSKSTTLKFDNNPITNMDNVNDPNYSPDIQSKTSVKTPMDMNESKINYQKTTIKNKYLSTTKKPSLSLMNNHLKNKNLNKSPPLTDNMDTTTEISEYEIDDNQNTLSTTKHQKPSTNKYLSAKATTTMTPLTKSKINTKLHSKIPSTPFNDDITEDATMSGIKVHEKTAPSKKSSDSKDSMSYDKSSVMSIKTTNDISNSMEQNPDSSSSSDYSYYYEDDASTSPTTTKKQNDVTSRNIFKQIGSFTDSSKSTIKISSLPTTKLSLSTPQNALSTQSDYYYDDNTLDNVGSTKLPNKTILFPQSKDNFDEKSTSKMSFSTQKPMIPSGSSISWHGDAIKTSSSHSTPKKPVSTEEDYLTDTNLEDEAKDFSNTGNNKHSFGSQPMNFPGNKFPAQGFPVEIGKDYLQPLPVISHNPNPGPFSSDNIMSGQNFPQGSIPNQPQLLNFPGPSNTMDRKRPTFDPDSLTFGNKNEQGIRSSPFDDDLENLTTEEPVLVTTKGKPSKKNNSKLDKNQHTDKVKPTFSNSKDIQSKDKNLENPELQDSTENVNPSLNHEITSSKGSLNKGNAKLKVNHESSSINKTGYNVDAFHSPDKKLLKTQGINTDTENSDNSNSLRPQSLPLCRTRSGFLKRNALVLNCKNETVQLQSAYQPWNNLESAFKITLCSPESSSHDQKIIAGHPELEANVNNFQCSKAKGKCVQRFTELVAMIHTTTGAQWDCIKIPLGCTCDLSQ